MRRVLPSSLHWVTTRVMACVAARVAAFWSVLLLSLAAVLGLSSQAVAADDRTLVVAAGTSLQHAGFFEHVLPTFKARTGIDVRVVAVGTGQALAMAKRGDADVVFGHDAAAESAFVAQGFGLRRVPVMSNDFLLVGPADDPARVKGLGVVQALAAIANRRVPFVSRGDLSGTHQAELRLWRDAGVDLATTVPFRRECGCTAGAALALTHEFKAYALVDRATMATNKQRGGLTAWVQGDAALANPYSVVVAKPAAKSAQRLEAAQRFADWMMSSEGQAAVASFRVDGRAVFVPNAEKTR
jgi:tungstate transport system substrate-binding protein